MISHATLKFSKVTHPVDQLKCMAADSFWHKQCSQRPIVVQDLIETLNHD